jgi:hypothetical protein
MMTSVKTIAISLLLRRSHSPAPQQHSAGAADKNISLLMGMTAIYWGMILAVFENIRMHL